MLVKFLIVVVFLVILYNLFASLKFLTQKKENSEGVYNNLKWRIIISATLFVLIILGFVFGIVPMHTL